MQVAACLNIFNEVDTVKATLDSVAPYVDKIIVVDGAYAKFPNTGNNGASNDGTLELLKKLKEEWTGKEIQIIEAPGGPWENEMVKRTAYFNALAEGDWAFIIDGDERLAFGGPQLRQLAGIQELNDFDAGVIIFRFMYSDGHPASYGEAARLYQKKKGTYYRNTHAHLVYESGDRWKMMNMNIVIEHHDGLRPKERNEQRWEFYKSGEMR